MKTTFTLHRRVPEGQRLPKGYGLAYWDYRTFDGICYPIPLNIIIGCAQSFWTLLQHGIPTNKIQRMMIRMRNEARMDGIEHGKELAHAKYRKVIFPDAKGGDMIFYVKD